MKICITSSGENIADKLDPRFGRCSYFIIADLESGGFASVPNEAGTSGGGAGIGAGQLMTEKGVAAVITGNIGPNAMNVLKAAGIGVYRGENKSIEENIAEYKAGKLTEITETVPSHSGMRGRS